MMTNKMTKICVYLFIIFIMFSSLAEADDNLYKLVKLSQDRGAACLDGTPPAIYVHEGKGENKNNFLIYFQGGGFCGQSTLSKTLESCYSRSFTHLGSSSSYSPTMDCTSMGAVSPIEAQNPVFYDWTKIVGKYCDGHEFLGHRQNAIQFKDKKLFFRGSRNVKQIFYYLNQKYDFYNGGKIVIGGGSAGGICAYQWSNYLHQNTKKAKVYTNPDSGFFITDYRSPLTDSKLLRPVLEPLLDLVFNETQLPQPVLKCLQNGQFDFVDCMNVANYAQYIKTPIFIVNSPYDLYSVVNIVGAKCHSNKQQPYSIQNCNETVRAAIEDYRLKSIQYFKQMRNGRGNVGIWGPACVQHSFEHITTSYFGKKYQVNGVSLWEAIQKFLNDPDQAPWLLDEIPWPENQGCNGLDQIQIKENLKTDDQ